MRKKERFVLGKRTFRSQKSKHFVLRIIYAISLLDAGYSFLLLAKLDSAEHYTLQGLRMAELIDSKEEKQTAVRNLGIIYSERKEYQKALGLLLSLSLIHI